MDITGNIEDIVVPLFLFLYFIKNCFKHGLKVNDKIKITLSFEIVNKSYLEFKLVNNFNPKAKHNNKASW